MKQLMINISPPLDKEPTLFERFKVSLWNFILPPHVRLGFSEEDES